MITLDSVSKKMGTKVLFENVSLTFNEGCRYGLTGPNGAGKSTLLKIIMHLESADAGSVNLPEKVGYLRQDIAEFENYRVLDCVIMGNQKLWKALEKREALYEMPMSDAIGLELGNIEEIIAEEDGYSAEAEAEILLIGMDISEDFYEKKMGEIPTDYQFKVLLCQAIFGTPQALILDEPTNHLEMSSIAWLQNFLLSYRGTVILVSHDKYFLNAVTTHIADIDYETIITYPGNYDQMLVTKTSIREKTELENKAKEKKISQLKEFVARFGAGTRASQVQSRAKEIEKLQMQDLKKSNIQRPYIRFTPFEKSPGQVVFKGKKISKSYDEKKVFENFSFEIHRNDKIALIGKNGSGKTTLLKILANKISYDTGDLIFGHQSDMGYFPQNHTEELQKSEVIDLFSWLKEKKGGVYDQEVRSVLGKLLFGGNDAFKPLSALSGGECARALLGALMLNSPNVLLLDEPNNHLDLESVSALAWGLEEFSGTAIVASHDRDLLNRFANKVISLEDTGPIMFDGTLDEYLAKSST